MLAARAIDLVKLFLLPVCWLLLAAVGSSACGEKLSGSNQPQQGKSHAGPVTDYASLIAHLRAPGASVKPGGDVEQPFFSVKGKMIEVQGEGVQVFQYLSAAAADGQAALVSPSGSTIGTTKVHWMGPPHFYKKGKLLVLYVGDDDKLLTALEAALGRQFAGQ